jgi:hypothetical protein
VTSCPWYPEDCCWWWYGGCCWCCCSELRREAANYRSGGEYLEKNICLIIPDLSPAGFVYAAFAWLQPRPSSLNCRRPRRRTLLFLWVLPTAVIAPHHKEKQCVSPSWDLKFSTFINIVTIYECGYRRGIDWIIGFIDHLYTQHGSTRNYSAIAISTLYGSPQHPLSFSSLLCLHQPFPGKGSNNGDSSASRAQVLPSLTLIQNWLPTIPSTELDWHLFSSSLAESKRTQYSTNSIILSTGLGPSSYSLGADRRENTVSNHSCCCLCIRCCRSVFTEPLLSNGSLHLFHYSVFRRHVTIYWKALPI